MAELPLSAGGFQRTMRQPPVGITAVMVGLPGSPGVAVAEFDHELSPTPLVARTCTW